MLFMFFGSFITHTLHAAQQCYTDIVVSVFNNFGYGFAVFGAFCCGLAVFATPQCPPLHGSVGVYANDIWLVKVCMHYV